MDSQQPTLFEAQNDQVSAPATEPERAPRVRGLGPLIKGVLARRIPGRPRFAIVEERGQAYAPGTQLGGEWEIIEEENREATTT